LGIVKQQATLKFLCNNVLLLLSIIFDRKEAEMQDELKRIKHGAWLRNGYSLTVKEVVEFAVEAEKAKWDGVFVSDELSGSSDPWTVLAAIAVKTTRVRIGTWITPAPNHLPWRLAQILASLDQLSDGRVILGVGLGTPHEYEAFTGSYDPKALARKYDESLEIMTQLWQGEPVSFSGEFFTLREAQIAITPVQKPRIPILLGGWWPNKKPFRRAARWDGIMPYWPALMSQGTGPQGEEKTGSVEDELRELIAYYRQFTDEPGEILLPDRPDESYRDLCKSLGVTWMLGMETQTLDDIRQGPPT
jgi:hypothetical protein